MSDQDKDFIKFLYDEDLYLIKGEEPVAEEVEINTQSDVENQSEKGVESAQQKGGSVENQEITKTDEAEEVQANDAAGTTVQEPAPKYAFQKTSDLLIIFEKHLST